MSDENVNVEVPASEAGVESVNQPVDLEASQDSDLNLEAEQSVEGDEKPEEVLESEEGEEKPEESEEEKPEEESKATNKLSLKVDGQELEEELPFEIDPNNKEAVEFLQKNLQFAKVAQKRMAESAQLEKELGAFFEKLREDPISLLSSPEIGIDMKKEIEKFINTEATEAQKTPEQKEQEKKEKELREWKEKAEKLEQEKRNVELKQKQQAQYDDYMKQIDEGLPKYSLPKSDYVLKKVSSYMLAALDKGMVDVKVEDVLPAVKTEIEGDFNEMLKVAPREQLEQLVGKDFLENARKDRVSKGKKVLSKKPTDVTKDNEEEKPEEKKTFSDFFGPGV